MGDLSQAYWSGQLGWDEVEAILGAEYGQVDAPCPNCGPDRQSPRNRVRKVLRVWRSEADFATYHCARCGFSGWAKQPQDAATKPKGAIARALSVPPRNPKAYAERERRERAEKVAFAEFIWLGADPISGTPAERYLASRGLTPGDDLRFAPLAPTSYTDARSRPAMVAAARDATGAFIGVHLTYLDANGMAVRRASGEKLKLMFGRVVKGAVRLAPVGGDGVLAVGEGIETARAFSALHGVPAWAALSAAGVSNFEPPHTLKRLIVAADNDPDGKGLEAAQALAKRAQRVCEVVVAMPKLPPGSSRMDWADVLAARRAAA